MLDCLRSAAHVSPEEAVSSPSVPGAHMAAFGVNGSETIGFHKPARAEAEGIVESTADDSATVEPPAIAAQKLAHI